MDRWTERQIDIDNIENNNGFSSEAILKKGKI